MGKKRFETVKFHSGVLIGAARDDEFASEFDTEDGQSYGMFTYYWVQGLQKADPGESWYDESRPDMYPGETESIVLLRS